tara:strand:- start:30 stop:191 length:162 start_codon:yes stop_codon:yes gene_type:complete
LPQFLTEAKEIELLSNVQKRHQPTHQRTEESASKPADFEFPVGFSIQRRITKD